MSNGGGFYELQQFQQHLSNYKISVFDGFNPDRVMFSGNSLSAKKFYLLHDRDLEHSSVIRNLKGVWLRGIYVTDVTLSTIIRTNVTMFAPCVLLLHPVLKMRPSIVLHATGDSSVR